jgi:selenocysteine lyase/cysteine desulfurase
MPIDVSRARAETPGCTYVTHLNNAGAALMPAPVVETMTGYLALEAQIGGYEAADLAAAAIEQVYTSIAGLIGCAVDEVAVVENATRAWDMAFYALPLHPGDRVLTARAEYVSNYLALLQVARRTGAQIEVLPNDASGQLSLTALADRIDDRVKLIAITHVPTNGGLINPAAEVGQIARAAGIPYLLDACQSVGQMPVDVQTLGCDFLSTTGRKFLRGPRGTGFLYVRRARLNELEPPFIDVHAARWSAAGWFELRPDARRFEHWESNYAAKLGLGAAVDYALGWGLDSIWARVAALADELRALLGSVPGVAVHDLGQTRCGIVTFAVAGQSAAAVQAALSAQRINVSTCTAANNRLDMEPRGLVDLVRASVHYYNTQEELVRLCHAVAHLARESG